MESESAWVPHSVQEWGVGVGSVLGLGTGVGVGVGSTLGVGVGVGVGSGVAVLFGTSIIVVSLDFTVKVMSSEVTYPSGAFTSVRT